MHEMTVYGVSFDLVGKQPIVLLRAAEGPMYLPIWIGHPEAAAILMRLQGQEPPRPLTHDLALLARRVARRGGRPDHRDRAQGRHVLRADHARPRRDGDRDRLAPSDAIALAIRADAKIFAEDEVMDESGVVWEGDVPDLAYAQDVTDLGEVDLGRVPEVPRHRDAGRVRDRLRRPALLADLRSPSSRFVSARSSVTSASRPSAGERPAVRGGELLAEPCARGPGRSGSAPCAP